jgi:hypothetical protein
MQVAEVTSMEFRKEHTWREILHYIFDFDSPELTLKVRFLYHLAKALWILMNVVATIGSCLILVLQSMPNFYDGTSDAGGLTPDAFGLSELACVLFFTFDYAIRVYLTPLPKLKFVFDAHNMIDLLTTIPYYIQLILSASSVGADGFRVIFLLRTFRLIKLARYHPGLEQVLMTLWQSADLLLLFLILMILIVVFSGTAFFYAERTRYDFTTRLWMRQCPYLATVLDPYCAEQISPYQSIPDAMYWAIVTITTVGYRGETPSSAWGKVIGVLTATIGVLFFAAPATVLSTNYKIIRRRQAAAQAFKKIDVRTTAAMMAQERLKKEMALANRHRHSNGRVRFFTTRKLKQVAEFTFEGFTRPIYEVIEESEYVYPPILTMVRNTDEADPEFGKIQWQDDFNPTTSQRQLTLLLVMDSDVARAAARDALSMAGLIGRATTENEVLVAADQHTRIEVRHDFALSYPALSEIVALDNLDNATGYHQDVVPLRFTVDMPHLYPSMDIINLLKETRLRITVATSIQDDIMYVPLVTDVIMATRFVRELSEIAWMRESDQALIAYIHHSDAAELLMGFHKQFMPTPSNDMMLYDGYAADLQVLSAIISSFPHVRLRQVQAVAANSFYRGQHLSIDLSDEKLLEVNLTALATFDDLGFGHRFKLEVPVQTVEREDVQFQLV